MGKVDGPESERPWIKVDGLSTKSGQSQRTESEGRPRESEDRLRSDQFYSRQSTFTSPPKRAGLHINE